MATKIKIKQTSIAGRTPSNDPNNTAYIEQGELALNTADHKLFSKDSNGDVFVIGGGAGGGGASGLEEWKWKWKKWETGYSEPMGSDPEAWTTWFKEKTNSAVTPDLEGFLDTKSAVNAQGTFGGDVGNMFPAGIDSYTAHIHTFIYVNQEFSISSTLKGDSTFALFIDEVFVDGSTLSFEDVAYSHTLTKGWHAIDLIYSVSGRGMGDYVQLGWNPQDYSQITAMTPTYATGSVNLPLTGGTLSGDLDVSGHISASSLTLGNYEQIYWSPTTLMYGHATNGISLITQGATRLKIQDNGNIEMDSNLDVAGNVTVDGTVDGRDVATDGTKLDGIASNAQVNTTSEPISYITGLQTALNQKASITYVDAEVSALVNSAPATLNTLKELSDALGNDDNHATTMTNLVGTKLSLSGGVMSGDLNMATNEIYLGTNSKLRIGNGQDLEIYHDGNDSHITDRGKGLLFIRGSVGVRIQGANGENGITLNENASVDLYHNNSRKLSTTSSGIDVTGTVAATSFTSTGNVGIGTTNPSHNLSVAGTLGISEVNATGSRLKIFTSSAGAYFNQHDNSNIYFQQIGQTKLTIEYPTGELLFANDTEHRIGKLTTGISGVVETTRIMGRNIDLYAYDDVNIRAGSGDKITMHTGSGHTERMRITSTGNVEMSGNLKLSTVPSTTANAFVPILFQPTEGTISGDSALTWNPAQDALDINGTHITSNYIRSSGTNSLKFGTASAGQIVELTSTGNVEMNGNLDVTGSVSVGSTAVIGSDAKIDANKIKNVPSSWLIGDTDTWRSISDSVSSTSTTVSASSKAVKTAYDKANHSHPYLPSSGKAVDADKLDGIDSTGFVKTSDVDTTSTQFGFTAKKLTGSGIGNSYDKRVVLLIPRVTTNTSHHNKIVGKLTAAKTGGNVFNSFDISANSVYNNTEANMTSMGQHSGHKFVTCTYNNVLWLAIEFSYSANPYTDLWFHGQYQTSSSLDVSGDGLKVISYYDTQNSGTILNASINSTIADFSAGDPNLMANGAKVWNAWNHGSGSGLDADLLDGKQASAFALAHSHPYNNYILPASVVHETEKGALHATDALRISGHTISLYKGNGTSESVTVPDNNTHRSISDSISSTSTTVSASSKAVKTAYDKANHSHPYSSSSHTHTGLTSGAWSGIKSQTGSGYIDFGPANSSHAHIYTDRPNFYFNKQLLVNGSTVWNAGNDGSGSGLDADLLDGKHASSFALTHSHPYLPLSGGTITGDIKFDAAQDIIVGSTMHSLLVKNTAASSVGLVLRGSNNEHRMQLYGASNGYGFLDGPWASWDIKKVPSGIFEVDEGSGLKRVWNAGNDGSGSGLDADLLDGKHASSFALAHSHPYLPSSGKAVDADKLDGLDLHTGTNNHANKVVRTDGNGYLNVGWINTASGNMNYANNISRVYCSNDGYLRYLSAREFKVLMGLSGRTTYDRRDYTTDTNYHIGAISHGAESMDTTFHKGDGFTDNWSNPAGQPSGTSHWTGHQSLHYSNGSNAYGYQFVVGAGNPALTYIRGKWGSSGFTSWAKVWNDKNDGSGSGLDADLLDGKHASSFALTHSHPYLASSGKAVDSDKLDGIDSTSFMRSDATDYQNNTIYQRGYLVNETGYRDKGVYGNYDSHKTNMIWSMGIAYKSHSSGNTFGNLYGLAYKHTNNVNGGAMGGSHQVVWCHNGTPRGAIGYDRVWHAEGMSVGTSYNKVWHAGNDGSGSGLDADKLDGVEPSNYANANTIARRDQNGNLAAGTFNGRATSANWADLAEKYEADTEYGVGVVLGIGGDKEVTKYVSGMPLAGVVSMEPALQMNVTEETTDWPFVALKGRVPVNINGSAKKGDYIIADDDGKGIAIPEVWSLSEQNRLIGIALEDGHDTIEVKI